MLRFTKKTNPMGRIICGLILMASPIAIVLFTGSFHYLLIVAFFVGVYLLVSGTMADQEVPIKKTRSDILDDWNDLDD